jgi:hypothetical protein
MLLKHGRNNSLEHMYVLLNKLSAAPICLPIKSDFIDVVDVSFVDNDGFGRDEQITKLKCSINTYDYFVPITRVC